VVHTVSYSMGTGDFFSGVKRPRRVADHLLPTAEEVDNEWNCIVTPPHAFMACVPDFGRVFLMLKYTDITQNTYVQS